MGEYESESVFEVPIGPQHPALKEPAMFMFKVDGEYVVDVDANVNYNHRGMEKAAESRTYIQNLYLMERVCGICSFTHQLCFSQGVEQLLEVEAPPRAQYIRVIIGELERIHSHLLWLGVAAHEIGFDTLFYYVWRDREIVLDLLETISGNRQNYAMSTIGGVRRDITDEQTHKAFKSLKILEERTKFYQNMIPRERTILKRGVGVGVLKPADAIALCAAGPTLRMTGVKSDVRFNDPYQAYGEIPWNVVTYDTGDVVGQVMVRVGEVLEAVNISRYALQHLPTGPIRRKVPRSVPSNETVSKTEAPRGENIHYGRSNGTDKPDRWKVRAPTLANIPAVSKMLTGGYIADIPIVLAGIDPCFSCTARVAFVDVEKNKRWFWSQEELRRYGIKWYGG